MPFTGFDYLDPIFAHRARRFCRAFGWSPTSGFRDPARQHFLWLCHQNCRPECNGDCAPANEAGTSWHDLEDEQGHPHAQALDAQAPGDPPDWTTGHKGAADYGLHFPIIGEPWHMQPLENTAPSRPKGALGRLLSRLWGPRRRDDDDR